MTARTLRRQTPRPRPWEGLAAAAIVVGAVAVGATMEAGATIVRRLSRAVDPVGTLSPSSVSASVSPAPPSAPSSLSSAGDEVPSWRCTPCGESYPQAAEFRHCRACDTECSRLAEAPTMTTEQARAHFRAGEFSRRDAANDWEHPELRGREERPEARRVLESAEQILELERVYRLEVAA